MNEIRRVLKLAAWRLLISDIFHTLAVTLSASVAALIVTLLAQRIFGLVINFPGDWLRLAAVALGAGVLASITWSVIRRSRGVSVARQLDERADLRESLSTAMCVSNSQDAWAKVVVEVAREKAMKVDVRRAIPYAAPRLWPVPLALMLAMVVLWFAVPTWDVLGHFKKVTAKKEEESKITEVKAEVQTNEKKLEELLKQAKVDLKADEATAEASENKAPLSAEEIRRAAVKKLTNQVDKLGAMKQGDKAKQLEAIKQAMKQIKQPGPGPMDQVTKALQKGDFKKAEEALNELSKQMGDNQMSPEDKAKAQEQMKKLAEQLDKLAKNKSELEKQLQQAGMSKEQAQKAASSSEEMKKALDQMKEMSEQEKQDLMKAAKAQEGASKQCQGLSDKMGEMAKGSGKEGMSQQAMEAAEAMAGQLSEMEMMNKDMEAMDAAMDEAMKQLGKMAGQCKGGNCNGQGEGEGELAMSEKQSPWRAGETQGKYGSGTGGPGQSGGGANPNQIDAPVKIDKVKSPTKQGGGPIIGSTVVQGDQVRGESTAAYSSAVEAASKEATEAIDRNQVSKEYEKTVKHYFSTLDDKGKKAKKSDVQVPAPATTPAAAKDPK